MLLVVPTDLRPPRGLFCWAWPLCVPVGGSPPARSPHASLRLGVVDLEARPGPAAAHRHRGRAPGVLHTRGAAPRPLAVRAASCARSGRSRNPARPCHRPPAPRPGPLWSLRHYANPSNNERPGPQPHNQTLNNVRTRPVVQCLPMGRGAYPRLGLLVWAVHPIRRHYTPSVRVHRHITGAPPRNGCSATIAHRHRGQAPQASRRPRSVGLVVCVLTGSAVAHLRRGQVLQSLRRPPHRQGLVCWCVVRRSVISHAIRRPHCAGLCQFVMLRHLCL